MRCTVDKGLVMCSPDDKVPEKDCMRSEKVRAKRKSMQAVCGVRNDSKMQESLTDAYATQSRANAEMGRRHLRPDGPREFSNEFHA